MILFGWFPVLFIHTPLLCSLSLFLTAIFVSAELNQQLVKIRVTDSLKPRHIKGNILTYSILK